MATVKTNKELMAYTVKFCKSALLACGRVEQTVVGITDAGDYMMVNVNASDETKDQFADACRTLFIAEDIDRYVTWSDSWYATVEKDELDDGRRPSERPDRKEAIVVAVVTREEKLVTIIPYTRSEDGDITFEKPITDTDEVGGRMMELLPPKDVPKEVRVAARKAIELLNRYMEANAPEEEGCDHHHHEHDHKHGKQSQKKKVGDALWVKKDKK